jgi:hypothetical protein
MNEFNPLGGGFPCDNNIIEGGNHHDKEFLNRNKKSMVKLIKDVADMVHNQSTSDLSFMSQMKDEVNSLDFYSRVYHIVQEDSHGRPSCLASELSFPITFKRNDSRDIIPSGSFIVVSGHLINGLKEKWSSTPLTTQQCKKTVLHKTSRKYSMLATYQLLFTDPDQLSTCPFDDLVDISKNFHLLRPLLDKSCINMVYQMLQVANLKLISLADLLERGPETGFVRCNCVTYMHYAWCQHSCAFAFKFGIITGYPKNKNPTPLHGHGTSGRPSNARRGGALSYS